MPMHVDLDAEPNTTLEDLWPGDVIIARRPGGLCGMPYVFVDTRETTGKMVMVKIRSLDAELEYEVPAFGGWKMPVTKLT